MDWGIFRPDKALEVILYVLSKGCNNMYNVLKVLYFADKEHILYAGSTIFNDRYIAMQNGPVPSGAYDLIKSIKTLSPCNEYKEKVSSSIKMEAPYNLLPLRSPNIKKLSNLDCKCLDLAIEKYGAMVFGKLKNISHQEEDYQAAGENDTMSFDKFLDSVDKSGNVRMFLEECVEEVC